MFRLARSFRWVFAVMIALAAVSLSFGAAAAAPATAPEKPTRPTAALERRFKAEQARLNVQRERFQRLSEHATRLDALIAKAKAKGKDTSNLEQAVAAFRAALEQASSEWKSASDTLATHAGFDDAGKVVDADQARAMLQSGHEHMQQARQIVHNALKDLRDAVKAFRKANRSESVPATPTDT